MFQPMHFLFTEIPLIVTRSFRSVVLLLLDHCLRSYDLMALYKSVYYYCLLLLLFIITILFIIIYHYYYLLLFLLFLLLLSLI